MRTVRTPDSTEIFRAAVIRSPHPSSSVSTSLQYSNDIVTLFILPCVQVIDRPGTQTKRTPKRRKFWERILVKINMDDEFINSLWTSNEFYFHLNWYRIASKQYFRYRAQQNPSQPYQRLLHNINVTVYYVVSSYGITRLSLRMVALRLLSRRLSTSPCLKPCCAKTTDK